MHAMGRGHGIYLPWNVPRKITVGRKLELTGLLGPVVHDLNVPRLHKYGHKQTQSEGGRCTENTINGVYSREMSAS